MPVIQIASDSLIDIEHHFRVSAGPGAGKTHWIVEHIKNVLHNSHRLAKTKRIACITYTNIAVDTILKRLGTTSEKVEVLTIHSFLYRHVLKPYGHFIASEYQLNIQKMDGHDDVILSSYGFLDDWKNRTGQKRITDNSVVIEALRELRWRFEGEDLVPRTNYPHKFGRYPIKNDSYLEYKKMAWERGIVHHDDVLFLSYQIVKKFPFVLDVLRAKFPYLFIDEFQDSNPIQISIIKSIAARESIIGIIGDRAQSIYGFLGADPSQFHSFSLPGIIDYEISSNRRSTNEIITFLNSLRTDITQSFYRNVTSFPPTIFVGDASTALQRAKSACGSEALHSLSRENITSNAMKREISVGTHSGNLFEELQGVDSDPIRPNFLISCIKSVELARENKFKDAIKEMERSHRHVRDKLDKKRNSLAKITILLEKYEEYSSGSLLNFSLFIKGELKPEMAKVTRGAPKTFYDNHTYQQLALCVKVPEDISHHKTIHKAKGDEFHNVLLVLKEEVNLAFILTPNIHSSSQAGEEQRINYVAVSRAKNRLFITVPTLSAANQAMLQHVFQIERL